MTLKLGVIQFTYVAKLDFSVRLAEVNLELTHCTDIKALLLKVQCYLSLYSAQQESFITALSF